MMIFAFYALPPVRPRRNQAPSLPRDAARGLGESRQRPLRDEDPAPRRVRRLLAGTARSQGRRDPGDASVSDATAAPARQPHARARPEGARRRGPAARERRARLAPPGAPALSVPP